MNIDGVEASPQSKADAPWETIPCKTWDFKAGAEIRES